MRPLISCLLLVGLLKCACCETDSSETQHDLQSYQRSDDLAIMAEKNEANSTKHLLEEYSVKLVKKSAEFRVEIALHKNNVFGRDDNEEWVHCVRSKDWRLKIIDNSYSTEETTCLREAQATVTVSKHGVKQIAKEVRNWRKGFKYITHVCRNRNPWNKTISGDCIVQLMSDDNFAEALNVLLDLLKESQQELRNQTTEALQRLHDCLTDSFSTFLTGLREVMADLDKCYRKRVDFKNTMNSKVNTVDCVKYTDLKCVDLK